MLSTHWAEWQKLLALCLRTFGIYLILKNGMICSQNMIITGCRSGSSLHWIQKFCTQKTCSAQGLQDVAKLLNVKELHTKYLLHCTVCTDSRLPDVSWKTLDCAHSCKSNSLHSALLYTFYWRLEGPSPKLKTTVCENQPVTRAEGFGPILGWQVWKVTLV